MKFTRLLSAVLIAVCLIGAAAAPALAQNTAAPTGAVAVQPGLPYYYLTPISATAAVNNQVTLTIPAAAGLYNYVCQLTYHASQDGTATAQTNAVTTSTNFNAFAIKYSLTATATINFDQAFVWGTPGAGCVKSTLPGTATTFVSPVAGANIAFSWYATYFQGL